ncbi:MAG: hypothetical protein AABW89_01150 [Nanoarchaeota archaeon]
MTLKKLFITIFSILLLYNVSALGISPAIKDISFIPGETVNITFNVLDASEDSTYDISIRGGSLTKYSVLSAQSIKGQGTFILTIKFPNSLEEPGQHTVSVSIKERPSEESFINTVVEVGSVIRTFVPYPGIYGELSLNIPDGNIDDKIPVELKVINRGDKILELDEIHIDFISAEETISKTLNFTPVDIQVNGERYFRKYLDTQGIKPGNYLARARVLYSEIEREINKSMRIGSPFVNITNHSKIAQKGGIQKFYISLESLWNTPISAIYVDVNISNNLESYSFRTQSTDLNPWEKKTIESYFDTERLQGNYNLTLNASYVGKSTTIEGNILIEDKNMTLYIIAGLALLLIIIIITGIILKNRKRKK